MLDQSRTDAVGALVDEAMAEAAIAASARKGYLDGRKLAEVFAWLRPGDLIWNYWVNNYLLGREPARFDILFWNADTTRMTAGLHRDFVRAALANSLASPGGLTVLGTEIDLAQVDLDSYVVAGVADHICPWQSCYRGSQLLGGKTRFVLSTSGHIAALVNPADNKKSSVPGQRRRHRGRRRPGSRRPPPSRGSWWPDYASWLADPLRRPGAGPGRASAATASASSSPPRAATCGAMRTAADLVRTVTVGGQRLRVAVRPGAGGGPPLLVCNGIGTPLEALAPFTGVAGPGDHGRAVRRARHRRLAADPAALLRSLAGRARRPDDGRARLRPLRRPRASPGAAASPSSSRCSTRGAAGGSSLVATSTGSLMIPARPRVLLHLSSPRRHRDPAHAARIAGDIYGGALRRRPELAAPIARRLRRAGLAARLPVPARCASAGWTSLPWLRLIRQPVLILAGDDDPIIPLPNARLMAALLPAARLHVYPDGHLGLLTRAAELAPLVSDFLLAVEPGRTPRGPMRHMTASTSMSHHETAASIIAALGTSLPALTDRIVARIRRRDPVLRRGRTSSRRRPARVGPRQHRLHPRQPDRDRHAQPQRAERDRPRAGGPGRAASRDAHRVPGGGRGAVVGDGRHRPRPARRPRR